MIKYRRGANFSFFRRNRPTNERLANCKWNSWRGSALLIGGVHYVGELCVVIFPFSTCSHHPVLMRALAPTTRKIMAQGTQLKYSAWFVAGSGLCVGLGFLAKRALSRKKGYRDVVETPTSNPGWSPPNKQTAPEKGAFCFPGGAPIAGGQRTGMFSRLPPHTAQSNTGPEIRNVDFGSRLNLLVREQKSALIGYFWFARVV